MNYDVIIATRNRLDAIKLSIPLILSQSRKPASMIVVDSSDDHEPARELVESLLKDFDGHTAFIEASPPLPQQRNIGLEHCDSPVVFFPDDDSLWHPGYAESIMRVYERDEEELIGAVTARPTNEPPIPIDGKQTYEMSKFDKGVAKINNLRTRLEQAFLPDPLWVAGSELQKNHPVPDWLDELNTVRVDMQAGYRMSFRRKAIMEHGFDPLLGKGIGYAAYEDADATLKVVRKRLSVACHDALCYHHKYPSKRANGRPLGFFLMFNRALAVCRNCDYNSRAQALLKPYAWYAIARYSLLSKSQFERQRIRGTREAVAMFKRLRRADKNELDQIYAQCLSEWNQA